MFCKNILIKKKKRKTFRLHAIFGENLTLYVQKRGQKVKCYIAYMPFYYRPEALNSR